MKFLTKNGKCGAKYNSVSSTEDVIKKLRLEIKLDDDLSRCKWNIWFNSRTISIALVEAPYYPLINDKNQSDENLCQKKNLNRIDTINFDKLNTGGKKLIKKFISIIEQYHYEDIDEELGIDFTNFYYSIDLGRINKPFKVVRKSEESKIKSRKKYSSGEIYLIKYTERSIALFGDTKPIRKALIEMGGKYNSHLSIGPGFIFSLKMQDEVMRQFGIKLIEKK